MPSVDARRLPPPSNWQDFERLCRDLWAERWGDPNAQLNGRNGQAQHGVDIWGQDRTTGDWCGIQCRAKAGDSNGDLGVDELRAAVDEARHFTPPLSEFTIATTGQKDARMEAEARALSAQHRAQSLFSVHVRAWSDILQDVCAYPNVLEKHYPEQAPNARRAGYVLLYVAAVVTLVALVTAGPLFARNVFLSGSEPACAWETPRIEYKTFSSDRMRADVRFPQFAWGCPAASERVNAALNLHLLYIQQDFIAQFADFARESSTTGMRIDCTDVLLNQHYVSVVCSEERFDWPVHACLETIPLNFEISGKGVRALELKDIMVTGAWAWAEFHDRFVKELKTHRVTCAEGPPCPLLDAGADGGDEFEEWRVQFLDEIVESSFALTPSGLSLYFDCGAADFGIYGNNVVVIPYGELRGVLRPEVIAQIAR